MIKRTPSEQRELVGACRSSGKAARAWCHENNISYSTYMGWVHLLAQEANHRDATREADALGPGTGKPEVQVKWAAVEPEAVTNCAKAEEPLETVPSFIETRETRARIRLSRGDWAIDVEGGFDAGLLADVMRVVNAVCC